jgi:hypothetical protein
MLRHDSSTNALIRRYRRWQAADLAELDRRATALRQAHVHG